MNFTIDDGKQLDIVPAAGVPSSALEIFFETAYPRRANSLKRNWRWLYNGISNDNSDNWPLLAVASSGEVVGLISSYPIQVLHNSQKHDATWGILGQQMFVPSRF